MTDDIGSRQLLQSIIEQQTAKIKQLEQTILMQDAQILSKDRLLDAYRGRENGRNDSIGSKSKT